jgi:hypothetical protein
MPRQFGAGQRPGSGELIEGTARLPEDASDITAVGVAPTHSALGLELEVALQPGDRLEAPTSSLSFFRDETFDREAGYCTTPNRLEKPRNVFQPLRLRLRRLEAAIGN